MNKYAIYTERDVYPVLEKDGEYYIGAPGTGHFSGQWKFLGVVERLKNSRNIIKPEDALKITDWKFKNGSPKYQVVDLDHGTVRRWASPSRQVISFGPISDNMFNVATKTDNDDEITLQESKKYAIYATYGGDGVYNSKLVDTVDSEEQAVDRVAELQATGVGASYEEVEDKDNLNEDKTFSNIRELGQYIENQVKKDFPNIAYVQSVEAFSNEDLDEFDIYLDIEDYNNKERSGQRPEKGKIEVKMYNDQIHLVILVPEYFDISSQIWDKYGFHLDFDFNNVDQAIQCIKDICQYIETKNEIKEEECSQASGVASGANGKIDSFPINPKEMEKQRLKESIDNPYFVIEDNGSCYLLAGPFNNEQEARKVKNNLIKKYNLEDEADIIYVWNWNRIKEYTYDAYDTYKEFINGCDRAPYYKEEKLEESKEDDIFNAREELIDYLNENTKYEWDANESYDNCAITESETDYIEVFVDIKDGNKIYTVDNYSYNSLEELVKNMPVLFTDEDEDYDYDEGWEDLDESKDLTKTLHEMALLEDYEDDISPQKQKFIEFCKDKIKDLGDIEIYDETAEENMQYHKIMHTEGIREFNNLYIVANFEEYDENLKAINNENKMVIDTPMIDCNGYAATMQFDEIDQEYYHTLLEYWNDLYMDEMIEEE